MVIGYDMFRILTQGDEDKQVIYFIFSKNFPKCFELFVVLAKERPWEEALKNEQKVGEASARFQRVFTRSRLFCIIF